MKTFTLLLTLMASSLIGQTVVEVKNEIRTQVTNLTVTVSINTNVTPNVRTYSISIPVPADFNLRRSQRTNELIKDFAARAYIEGCATLGGHKRTYELAYDSASNKVVEAQAKMSEAKTFLDTLK